MVDLIFDNPPPISRAEAEVVFASGQSGLVSRVLVQVSLHDPDWHWVQEVCVRFTDDADLGIRGVAATCLGHLASLHRAMRTRGKQRS